MAISIDNLLETIDRIKLNKKKKLDYASLWDTFLEANQQPTPQGFNDVINNPNAPKNYFQTPETMQAVIRAISPYDLYMNPDKRPISMDYPSSAFDIKNRLAPMDIGIKNAILQSSQNPQSRFSLIQSILEQFKKDKNTLGENYKPYFAQGVYEHEVGHYNDVRANPYDNKGFLKKDFYPTSTPIQSRESAGWAGEDAWRRFLIEHGLLQR